MRFTPMYCKGMPAKIHQRDILLEERASRARRASKIANSDKRRHIQSRTMSPT